MLIIKNKDRLNCRPHNLEWLTPKQNIAHRDGNKKKLLKLLKIKTIKMKNIHLIPTDKPSRLVTIFTNTFHLCKGILPIQDEEKYQHIYITNDENGKHGEWVYWEKDKESPIKFQRGEYLNTKKIILTTDQDLIADGIEQISEDTLLKIVEHINSGKNIESFDEL